jgi:hypothetical protein
VARIIAIDPGQWSGVAYFDNGLLTRADLLGKGAEGIQEFTDTAHIFKADGLQAVIEIPQVYPQRQWKGDPNDLIGVAYIAGIFSSWLYEYGAEITLVKPHEWKGSRPKDVDTKYTLKCLDAPERRIIPDLPKTKLHNVIDAIGIGLWYLKRR